MSKMKDLVIDILELWDTGTGSYDIAKRLGIPVSWVNRVIEDYSSVLE
jgi:hypothetical protein